MTTAYYHIEGDPPRAMHNFRKPGWVGLVGSQICCQDNQGKDCLCCINNMYVKQDGKTMRLREFLDAGGKLTDIK